MAISANPYLTFRDNNTREAMSFYASIFGGEPQITPLSGMTNMPDDESKTMHAELRTPEITLMGADNLGGHEAVQGNCLDLALMVPAADEARGREIFEKLSDGGQVQMPLEKQEWGDVYGSVVDRYGFTWAMNIEQS